MNAVARGAVGLLSWSVLLGSDLRAQAARPGNPTLPFSVSASMGAYLPLASVIRSADEEDTRLDAGPGLAVDFRYRITPEVLLYGGWVLAFGTVHPGSSIRADAVEPANRVSLGIGTAGILLVATDWLEWAHPTFRAGVGFKGYGFDFADSGRQVRPTGDIGVGLRSAGSASIELSADVRWFPSTVDQARLPTRGIVPQVQRQNDLMFTIGLGMRP